MTDQQNTDERRLSQINSRSGERLANLLTQVDDESKQAIIKEIVHKEAETYSEEGKMGLVNAAAQEDLHKHAESVRKEVANGGDYTIQSNVKTASGSMKLTSKKSNTLLTAIIVIGALIALIIFIK